MAEQIETEAGTKALKLTPKGLAQMQMMANGVDAKTAILLTNPSKDTVTPQAIFKTKAKFAKFSLSRPDMAKLAHNQIKRILKGECRELDQQKVTKDGLVIDYKEVIAPSDTNIIAAATMVYDRYEPTIHRSESVNLNIEAPIDLSRWSNKAQNKCNDNKDIEI
jgi:hypothetical protein